MKILVFAPFSAIWVHAFPEALVIESLQQSGHEIVYLTCGRTFSDLCVSMGAYGVGIDAGAAQKRRICDLCDKHKQLIREQFGFRSYDLSETFTKEDHDWVDEICAKTSATNLIDLVIDGIAVGKCALSHFLINLKKISLEFTDAEWARLQVELRNALYAFVGCRRAMDREKPDRVMVYVAAYSVNLVCCELAQARGIPHYYLAAAGNLSDRLQRIVVARGHAMDFQKNNIAHWPALKDKPCSADSLRYVTDHFQELFRGKNPLVYSTPIRNAAVDLRQSFGIRSEQKVLLAALSSYDEIYASQIVGLWPSDFVSIFSTQVEWVQALIAFVADRPDLFLIVRVHPRELPNRRDGLASESSKKLGDILSDLPDNVRVNWPTDGISLYEAADIADVCLNAWSSAGKELTLLGLPVVTYAPDLLVYPPELNYVSDTREGYFEKIETALEAGWSAENVRAAYRWYVLEHEKAMINLSESYSVSENRYASLSQRMSNRLRRTVDPLYVQRRDCARRAASLSARPLINQLIVDARATVLDIRVENGFASVAIEEESAALRREIARMVNIMYPSSATEATNTLKYKLVRYANSLP